MSGHNPRKSMAHSGCALLLAVLSMFFAGCSSIPAAHPPLQVQPPPVLIHAPPPATDFTVAGGMNDTWNAVGQILVRLDGVTYQGRAQMLGLYDVSYRGERFLIITRGVVLTAQNRVTTTQVRAALTNGKADGSDAAIELLSLLQARLPEEMRRIASGEEKGGKKTGRH